jgi:hypothetical protein
MDGGLGEAQPVQQCAEPPAHSGIQPGIENPMNPTLHPSRKKRGLSLRVDLNPDGSPAFTPNILNLDGKRRKPQPSADPENRRGRKA